MIILNTSINILEITMKKITLKNNKNTKQYFWKNYFYFSKNNKDKQG